MTEESVLNTVSVGLDDHHSIRLHVSLGMELKPRCPVVVDTLLIISKAQGYFCCW